MSSETRIGPWHWQVVYEHLWLVARGVRPMASLGCVPAADAEAVKSALDAEVARHLGGNAVSAVAWMAPVRADGWVECGFASHAWCVDLMLWADNVAAPDVQRDRILGLLFGYSAEAIARNEAWQAGGRPRAVAAGTYLVRYAFGGDGQATVTGELRADEDGTVVESPDGGLRFTPRRPGPETTVAGC